MVIPLLRHCLVGTVVHLCIAQKFSSRLGLVVHVHDITILLEVLIPIHEVAGGGKPNRRQGYRDFLCSSHAYPSADQRATHLGGYHPLSASPSSDSHSHAGPVQQYEGHTNGDDYLH